MKQHQELKNKIDGRSKTIQQCADLGKILIAAGNPASEEVRLTRGQTHMNYHRTYRKTPQLLYGDVAIRCCGRDCNLSVTTDKREVGQPSG